MSMRFVSCLLVMAAAVLAVGCASTPMSPPAHAVAAHDADLECIEVFDAGPIR